MGVHIIIDSSADFEPEEAERLGITLIPMKTTIDGVEYSEGVDLTREEFYEKLVESTEFPHTSQITPFEFARAIDAAPAGDDVLVITLSSCISSTYDNALSAAAASDRTVFIVDSENATVGERVLAERALQLVDEGLDARSIADRLDAEKKSIRLLAVLDTLEYLKKGGRISSVAAAAGSLLSIKPVVSVVDGKVVVLGKAHGSKQGSNLLRKLVAETGVDFSRPIRLGYTGFSNKLLRKYLEDSRDLFEGRVQEPGMSIVGSTIGTHVGPNAIAVAYFAPID